MFATWLSVQLKNIGRKYKKQAEDTQKEVDVMKKQQEETLKVRHLNGPTVVSQRIQANCRGSPRSGRLS